ncbi:MASE1 domain-containing protein [Microbacterium sp. EYE_5]|uniref:sensor histidine kinase n=1 Tax=unclassified Microbacterium TaxID=2609290 RepID=UPI002003F687|nr:MULTISPECIES: ATP-binding protein [unclassified Microbacterium]MCK6079058.1 MASE1 domain-containing protein [Microbacterium sp. EYE_382]MCK6084328.1 MASE1 domain-containing protein [Microbacterium sp. EYE_384]MCK6123443.1 MASE1 domain-containing protein [Microbacterium sp. EYE_80]MCK6125092.1 MASE1 domain-containing protein [Microbacterium sp. EYE_79]MCK6140012.1 MASE1 domain-containing protein [Microbacterium sp. EYE_39]
MTTPSAPPIERVRSGGRRRPWIFWIAVPLGIFALGIAGLTLRAPDLPIAIWWPAAGLSVWFALRSAPSQRAWALVAIFAATAASNAVAGRPWPLALLFGLANTLEAAVVIGALGRARDGFRLMDLTHAVRFVVASFVGAAVLGTVVGTLSVLFLGSTFFPVSVVAFASHSSAIMLIGGLAILPPRSPLPVRPLEVAIFCVTVGLTIAVAFGPVAYAHLSFLVFAVLAAGCLRFPFRVSVALSLVVCVAILLLTITAGGTFSFGDLDRTASAVTLVVFMSSVAVFTLLVAAARYDARRTALLAVRAAEDVAVAERARAAALAQQLDLERQREDFATVAGHEFRTPLTNIVGYTDLLQDSPLDDEQRSWADAISRGAGRLTGLLDDLAIERAGGERGVVPLDAVIADARAAHTPEATARRTEIRVVPTEERALADDADVRRALWSLVSNAVTFAEAGVVTISAARSGDHVEISVIDDGPGMSPETLANAFERFYRGREAEGRSAGGLGLGLASARDLARRNGGDVTIDSRPGHGVTAVLSLPAAPADVSVS